MRGDLSWATESLLANPAFLPSGKGALILILGGLAMLGITAVLARAMSGSSPKPAASRNVLAAAGRRKPARARSSPSSSRPAMDSAPVRRPGDGWTNGLERAVRAKHRGHGRVTTANRSRCFFVLDECRSCGRRRRGRDGCERERASIQKAARRLVPRARVYETSCNPASNGVCMFEIRREAPA